MSLTKNIVISIVILWILKISCYDTDMKSSALFRARLHLSYSYVGISRRVLIRKNQYDHSFEKKQMSQ